MHKALFFSKCKSKKSLQWYYDSLPVLGHELEYQIVKTIVLSDSDYNEFINGFLMYFDFIDNDKNISFMDESHCIHCLLIKSHSDSGILVYPAGFPYAKYVALNKIFT